jgi:hypothetical protein
MMQVDQKHRMLCYRKLSAVTKDWKTSDPSMHISTRTQESGPIIQPVAFSLLLRGVVRKMITTPLVYYNFVQ